MDRTMLAPLEHEIHTLLRVRIGRGRQWSESDMADTLSTMGRDTPTDRVRAWTAPHPEMRKIPSFEDLVALNQLMPDARIAERVISHVVSRFADTSLKTPSPSWFAYRKWVWADLRERLTPAAFSEKLASYNARHPGFEIDPNDIPPLDDALAALKPTARRT